MAAGGLEVVLRLWLQYTYGFHGEIHHRRSAATVHVGVCLRVVVGGVGCFGKGSMASVGKRVCVWQLQAVSAAC